jgi:hypothetical protein
VVAAAFTAALISAPAGAVAADLARGYFGGIDVVSTDAGRTALGVRGTESSTGTAKISHEPSAVGAADQNAAALSLRVEGAGTAAQGIFFDAPAGTAGKIENLRIRGREVWTMRPDPAYPATDPHVIVTVRGRIIEAP